MQLIGAKTIVSGYKADNPWFGNNYNMNIYKGCSHGCIYCDSRSQCYGVDNFDEVRAKGNALALIEKELHSKRKTGVIGTGAMSDPYNPMEEKYELTREALKLIHKYRFGVSIATKSSLVTRDLDLLQAISTHSPVLVKLTVTTSDDELAAKIEPYVASPSERFKALEILSKGKLYSGILMMPILPFLEDNTGNVGAIIELARQKGARFIYPAFGVTLRQNQRDWFFKALDREFPGIKEKYIRTYGYGYSCGSSQAKALYALVAERCKAYGMDFRMEDIIRHYREGYGSGQMTFF